MYEIKKVLATLQSLAVARMWGLLLLKSIGLCKHGSMRQAKKEENGG